MFVPHVCDGTTHALARLIFTFGAHLGPVFLANMLPSLGEVVNTDIMVCTVGSAPFSTKKR